MDNEHARLPLRGLSMINRRRFLALFAASAIAVRGAYAQTWPGALMRIIVAYPPGGPSDAVARALAEKLSAQLGTQVIIENRAGAGGSVGIDATAKSPPDGLTLAFAAVSPITLNPHVNSKLGYDPFRDVAAVAAVMISPVYVLATPAFSGKSFADVVAQAKAHPGALRLATSGVATVGHVMLEQIKAKAGIDITHIPYKGGGQTITDAAGGQFELLLSNPSPALSGQIANGRLRLLAVAAPQRLASYPNVATLTELGFAAANLTSTFGIFAPGRTPEALVKRLNAEINKALELPEVRERLVRLENLPAAMSPAEFAHLLRAEHDANALIIRAANIRAE
jgi:tripartite-type tricarboxylate transporter receptor subunit TctC